ncbi:MAG TPA: hypothetical protein EYN34_02785 [Aquifex sp.]|nr:hypothetical protein [Aquifex sp.]
MRIAVYLLLLSALFLFLLIKQPYLEVRGVSFEGGFSVDTLKLTFGGVDVGLYGIRLKGDTLSVGVVSVRLPPPRPVYALEVKKPDYGALRRGLNLFLKLLERLPIGVRVKDFYLEGGNLSVNLYGLRVLKGWISLPYGELFLPNGGVLTLKGVSLQGSGDYATLGGSFELSPLKGEGVISYDPLSGELSLNLSSKVGGKTSNLWGKLLLSQTLRGNLLIDFPFGVFGGNFTVEGFGLNLSASGRLEGKPFTLGGFLTLYPSVGGFLRGHLRELCGENVYFTLRPQGGDLSAALLAVGSEPLFLSAFIPRGGRWRLYGWVGNGTLAFEGNPAAFRLRAKDISFKNLCGWSVGGLDCRLEAKERRLEGTLSLKSLKGEYLSLEGQRLYLRGEGERLRLSFSGSLKGLILKDWGDYWGYLRGGLEVKGKPLTFSVSRFEFLKGWNGGRLDLNVEKLAWGDLSVEKLYTTANFGEGSLKLTLRGSGGGYLSYGGGLYRADIHLWFFKGGNPLTVSLKAEGSPRRGRGTFRFEDFDLSYLYTRSGNGYNLSHTGVWKFLSLKGDAFLSKKRFSLNETLYIGANPSGVTGALTLIGGGDTHLKLFEGKLLPFCLNLVGEKLVCFRGGQLLKRGGDISFYLQSLKGFPLYADIGVKIERLRLLSLNLLLKVKTSLLNRFLVAYGTFIDQPEVFVIPFSYRGSLSSFPKGVSWFYSTQLRVFSAYIYKPLKVLLTLSAYGGNLSALVGFADAFSGETYGSLSANLGGGAPALDADLTDFPLRVFLGDTLRGYLNVGVHGSLKWRNKTLTLNGRVLSGGFVRVLSYRLPTSSGKGNGKPILVRGKVSFLSSEPLYVETPDGRFTLTYSGVFENGTLRARVFINYGKLNLLGKTFYIHGGEVDVEGAKVELDIPLVYYAPGRTIYLHVYGSLPWENLHFDVYSTPPAPEEELLAALFAGGGQGAASNLPIAKFLFQNAVVGVANVLSSALIRGITVSFEPTFDPLVGFAVGVNIEKHFDDFATVGYHWMPSPNPKATYLWGSVKFFYNTFFRGVRYADGTLSLVVRFAREFGLPF